MIKYLLFDLGHVLVPVNSIPHLREMMPDRSDTEILRKWSSLKGVNQYESGQINSDEFFRIIPEELGISISPSELRNMFETWVLEEYEGATEFLGSLKETFRIGCLSNTNPVNMEMLKKSCSLMDEFDDVFLSHEIGFMKPGREIYEYVMDRIDYSCKEILFLDDSRDNVDTARSLGFNVSQVSGLDEVKETVKKYVRGL